MKLELALINGCYVGVRKTVGILKWDPIIGRLFVANCLCVKRN